MSQLTFRGISALHVGNSSNRSRARIGLSHTPSCRVARLTSIKQAPSHAGGDWEEQFATLPFRDGLLQIDRGSWAVNRTRNTTKLQGTVRITGLVPGQEIFIPQIVPQLHCIGTASISSLNHQIKVSKRVPGPGAAPEDPKHSGPVEAFWSVPIIRHNQSIEVLVEAQIEGPDVTKLNAAWIELDVEVYGPHGLETERQDVVLPLKTVAPLDVANVPWRECPYADNVKAASIPSHLLTHQDSPVSVVRTFVSHLVSDDHKDIVCIAESAVAIMQGRWLHYKSVKPGWLAKFGCRCFNPLSSMATACGLQAAIYLVGKCRVALGLVLGFVSRLIGIRGMFYRIVGAQATAIDDLTGTLPPFDRFLVYGPVRCDQVVQDIEKETSMRCAVVDVNDKSAVTGGLKVLAASPGVDTRQLMDALKHNPAGNAAEQTPIVLVRGIPCR